MTAPADGRLGWGADIRTELLRMLISRSRQFVEERLRVFEIGCVKTLGKPTIDRREETAGFAVAALFTAEPGEAYRGTQFP